MEANRLLKILLENGAIKQSQIDDEFLAERLADDEKQLLGRIEHIAKLELIEINRTKEREEERIKEIRELVDIYPKAEKILKVARNSKLYVFGGFIWGICFIVALINTEPWVPRMIFYFIMIAFFGADIYMKSQKGDVKLAKESIKYATHM